MVVENAVAACGTKRTSRPVTLTVVGLSLAVLGALTGCSGGSDEPVAAAPTPTTSATGSAQKDWQDDPNPAPEKADMEGNAIAFASGYAFEISRLAGVEKATVSMQNKALTSTAHNIEGNYYEIEVQNLSTAGKATVAISNDGLCATFTVPNSNDGSMSELSYAASPATATAGKGNTAPTCT